MFIHHCSIIPDGPSHVQQVLLGMGPALKPERHAFYDRIGQSVQIPRNDTGRNPHPWFDDGYAKACGLPQRLPAARRRQSNPVCT